MHAEVGIPVLFGLISGYGVWDVSDAEMLSMESSTLVGRLSRFTLHTKTFRSLVEGSILVAQPPGEVVDREYRVVATRQIGDGGETVAYVTRND